MKKRLENRLAMITGASRGIGSAVAKRYAEEGAHVILVARNSAALEEMDDVIQEVGGKATLVPMDLKEYDKIDALGAELVNRFGKLDILVGNAGILGGLSPVGHFSPKAFEDVMAINVVANWRLIRSMDPLLRSSESGSAIFVTSGLAQMSVPYYGAYAASKAALETLVKTYAEEVKQTSLKVNLVDPGVVQTAMRAEAMPGEDPSKHPKPEAITEIFVQLAEATNTEHNTIQKAA